MIRSRRKEALSNPLTKLSQEPAGKPPELIPKLAFPLLPKAKSNPRKASPGIFRKISKTTLQIPEKITPKIPEEIISQTNFPLALQEKAPERNLSEFRLLGSEDGVC